MGTLGASASPPSKTSPRCAWRDGRRRPSPHGSWWRSLVARHGGFGFAFALRMREQVFGGEFGVEDQVEEADHHLVGVLLSPDYRLGGVGILGIIGRVVEMRGALDF